MEKRDDFRDYSSVIICNESVQEIKRLIESKSKEDVTGLSAFYFEYEIITLLLTKIYNLREKVEFSLEANKNLAKERNDLKDELFKLKYERINER